MIISVGLVDQARVRDTILGNTAFIGQDLSPEFVASLTDRFKAVVLFGATEERLACITPEPDAVITVEDTVPEKGLIAIRATDQYLLQRQCYRNIYRRENTCKVLLGKPGSYGVELNTMWPGSPLIVLFNTLEEFRGSQRVYQYWERSVMIAPQDDKEALTFKAAFKSQGVSLHRLAFTKALEARYVQATLRHGL